MDSEVQRDGRILDLIDDAWREDKLPYEDVAIPLSELPEPEQDNGGTTESVKEQEMKWRLAEWPTSPLGPMLESWSQS